MTADEKATIIRLKKSGHSLSAIAQETGISRNTIKTFIRRAGLSETAADKNPETSHGQLPERPCQACGKPVIQYPGKKEKKFCSDSCRMRFWNRCADGANRAGMKAYICLACGATFYAYVNRNRRYCSHECYIIARFGGSACD